MLFSVIIPTYNRSAFIKHAIDSVLAQHWRDWELIVVDDASTDDTITLLGNYTDPRIRIIRNANNRERSASRNIGIAAATGEYICFLDSDDYYFNQHLSVLQVEIEASNHPVALIHTDVSVRDIHANELRVINYNYSSIRKKIEWVLFNPIQPNAVAIHRSIFKPFSFDTTLSVNEDVYLFAKIAAEFQIIHIPKVTVAWVYHLGNTTNTLRDYLTPQLHATIKIFSDSSIVVSNAFKKNKYFDLYSQLVYFHASNKKSILSGMYFIKGIWVAPFNKGNRTNLMNVIYHLPGGGLIKKAKKIFNRLFI